MPPLLLGSKLSGWVGQRRWLEHCSLYPEIIPQVTCSFKKLVNVKYCYTLFFYLGRCVPTASLERPLHVEQGHYVGVRDSPAQLRCKNFEDDASSFLAKRGFPRVRKTCHCQGCQVVKNGAQWSVSGESRLCQLTRSEAIRRLRRGARLSLCRRINSAAFVLWRGCTQANGAIRTYSI